MKEIIFLLLVSFLSIYKSIAQVLDSLATYEIKTKDWNHFIGKVLERNSQSTVLETEHFGILTIKSETIKSVKVYDPTTHLRNSESIATQYVIAPNGQALKKGEGYYRNTAIILNQASIGISKNFQIGVLGYFPPIRNSSFLMLVPKYSFPIVTDKIQLGIGGMFGSVIQSSISVGIAYTQLTIGSHEDNISLGYGHSYIGHKIRGGPVVSISGLKKISSRWQLISENYMLLTDINFPYAVSSLGFRWISNNAAIDFGAIIVADIDLREMYPAPWISLSLPFRIRKK